MLFVFIFAVCFMVYGANGKPQEKPNDVKLPCHFGSYDLDGNGEISAEEFLSVTAGFTKIDPKTLFGYLDTNGDGKIVTAENLITGKDPSVLESGIFDHCRRLRCCWICLWC
ncbi:neuron-specific calcium-binding protein hippocalcin-like [Crassostrea virginica]